MMIKTIKPFFFIFLTSLSPFLNFLAKNYVELYFYDFLYTFVYFFFTFSFFYLIFFLIKKKFKFKNNFYICFCYLILIFFNYNLIHSLSLWSNPDNFLSIKVLAQILWLIIFIFSFYYLLKFLKKGFFVTFSLFFILFLNFSPGLKLFYQILTIDREQIKLSTDYSSNIFTSIDKNNLQNVYYLLFDHYSRNDVYKKFYNFDNSLFLKEIEKYNFKVINNSATNVVYTDMTMTSIFDMNLERIKKYLNNDDSYEMGFWKSGDTVVQKIFKKVGYKHYMSLDASMHGSPCKRKNLQNTNIDKCISQKIKFAELEFNLLKMTPLFDILGKFFPSFFTYQFLYPSYITENLDSIIPNNQHIFYYMHFYMPHPPPKFGTNCKKQIQILDLKGDGPNAKYIGKKTKKAIVNDVKCINKLIIDFVEKLDEIDPNAIVVIQSDNSNVGKLFPYTHYNLNLWKLPKSCHHMMSDDITNVNTFRIVFNCLGVGNWKMQKNEIIDSKFNRTSDEKGIKIYNLSDQSLKKLEKEL